MIWQGGGGQNKKAKNLTPTETKQPPPPKKNLTLFLWRLCLLWCIISNLRVTKKFVTLHMSWELELQNRINIGFALGWSWYKRDEQYDHGELVLYLGLISLNLKYY